MAEAKWFCHKCIATKRLSFLRRWYLKNGFSRNGHCERSIQNALNKAVEDGFNWKKSLLNAINALTCTSICNPTVFEHSIDSLSDFMLNGLHRNCLLPSGNFIHLSRRTRYFVNNLFSSIFKIMESKESARHSELYRCWHLFSFSLSFTRLIQLNR